MGAKLKKPPVEENGESMSGFKPRTALARRLLQIRARYVASGGQLLNWDELEQELKHLRERNLP